MDFRTEINIPPSSFRLSHRNKMAFIGSCFTDNIGVKLKELKFPVVINPFGVVYNPLSVKRSLEILIEDKEYHAEDLNFYNGLWYSLDHHSSFSDPDKSVALSNINHKIHESSAILKEADYLLITFGTAWIYRLRENERIVCNCHKVPSSSFKRELLDPAKISEEYHKLYEEIKRVNPGIRFIFTISPVRHWKDGAHANQVSKAVLHLAVEMIQKYFKEDFDYFPAYEFLLDDLRDYRFYSNDLLHPNSQAIEYIWGKFSGNYFDDQTREINAAVEKIIKAAAHRANFPGSDTYRKFKQKQLENILVLEQKYPYLDLNDLKSHFI